MNALKYHWCETSLLSQAVLKHVVSKYFIFKKSVQGTGSESCQKLRNLWHCSISTIFHVMLQRNLQHVDHKWVICGSHPDCSVGQWVKWVNRCDPLSTLIHNTSQLGSYIHFYNYYSHSYDTIHVMHEIY